MDEVTRSRNAKAFAKEWSGNDYDENSNTIKFWIELLEQVFGVKDASKLIHPEMSVPNMNRHQDYIDIYIPSTHVVIEQKKPSIDLDKKEFRPSFTAFDSWVTPFEQAKTYNSNLPYSQHGRWVITCNFHQFRIYDTNEKTYYPKPTVITLNNLWRDYYQLDFLINPNNQDVKKEKDLSTTACKLITKIYHNLLDQYDNPKDPKVLQKVNKVCVRLVFCFYADDSGIFGKRAMFHDYMKKLPAGIWKLAMEQLFKVLDEKASERDDQLNSDLAKFPYVNGGLFANSGKLPRFTEDTKELILDAGHNFDWSRISPTIFGAMFETTLNPEERHINGMHYTSPKNIHKVIDPLFLNKLRDELNAIKTKYGETPKASEKAKKFQHKLASLTFFDPACGSGNFLTETYLCLRNLENQAIKLRLNTESKLNGQFNVELLGGEKLIEVKITQFYGIEINDFAVSVAKTAMWIAESQMVKETQNIVGQIIQFLPLTSNPNIHEANALRIDWNKVIAPANLNFIISNPPFVGSWKKNKAQKDDVKLVFGDFKGKGQLDYVACWYKKSADMMNENPDIRTALVSTNSIAQGQQVPILWKSLIEKDKFHIDFAYHNFKWSNSAKKKAQVVCVIIAFSHVHDKQKYIYLSNGKKTIAKTGNISPYLEDMPNMFIKSRKTPICNVSKAIKGNQPTDNGKLSRISNKNKQETCKKYPSAKPLFKRLMGASEFLHNKVRWCLWLYHVDPSKWLHIKPIVDDVRAVKAKRKKSSKKATRKSASTPYLFQEIRQPDSDYLLLPHISSLRRIYVPLGFMSKDIIINNKVFAVPHANLYDFGVLSSIINMDWSRLVSGKMGNASFQYSDRLTYNNFPWANSTKQQRDAISKTAQGILDARKNHPNDSLSELYDPDGMPVDLLKAHQKNDKAVKKAYGLPVNADKVMILTKLRKMYQKLTQAK